MKRSFRNLLVGLGCGVFFFGVTDNVGAQALQPPAIQQPPQQLPQQQLGTQQLPPNSQQIQQTQGQQNPATGAPGSQPRVIQNLQDLSPLQRQQIEKAQQWQDAERQRQLILQQQQLQQRQPQDPRLAQQQNINRAQYIDGNPNGLNPIGTAPGQSPIGQPLQNPYAPGQNPAGPINPAQQVPGQPLPGQNPGQPMAGGLVPAPIGSMPPVTMQPARASFELTAADEQILNKVLGDWEKANNAIKAFSCDFQLWEYNSVFGPKDDAGNEIALRQSWGKLGYESPDRGLFKTTDAKIYSMMKKDFEKSGPEDLKVWACDGKAMYQVDHVNKLRRKFNLPENMRGVGITEGPLPFVFGLKADKLKARYWMKVITPSDKMGQEIWIIAEPKYFADAANYKKVEVILNAKDLNPLAIRITKPTGTDKEVYALTGHLINPSWLGKWMIESIPPTVPFGYKEKEENFVDPAAQPVQVQNRAPTTPGMNPTPGQIGGTQSGNIPAGYGVPNTQPQNPNALNPTAVNPGLANPNGLNQPNGLNPSAPNNPAAINPPNQAMRQGLPPR